MLCEKVDPVANVEHKLMSGLGYVALIWPAGELGVEKLLGVVEQEQLSNMEVELFALKRCA